MSPDERFLYEIASLAETFADRSTRRTDTDQSGLAWSLAAREIRMVIRTFMGDKPYPDVQAKFDEGRKEWNTTGPD